MIYEVCAFTPRYAFSDRFTKLTASSVPVTTCYGECDVSSIQIMWKWRKYQFSVHRSETKVSWYGAEAICKEMGGHLVSLHDEAQMVMLRNALYHLTTIILLPDKWRMSKKTRKRQHQHFYFIGLQTEVRVAILACLFYLVTVSIAILGPLLSRLPKWC